MKNKEKMFNIIEHGALAEISMARPPVNAMTGEFLDGLVAAHGEVLAAGARGVVISGRPGLFSAGLDVPALIQLDRDAMEAFWANFFRTMIYLASSEVPVVAAITGHAPAGGAVLAVHCDYRVAAAGEFTLGLNETSIGLPVPRNIFYALEWVVGSRRAALLATTGALMSPVDALEIGLVDEVVEPAFVVESALTWLRSLQDLPAVTMNRSRLTAKASLLEKISEVPAYSRIATDAWFDAETQRGLRDLVAKLGK